MKPIARNRKIELRFMDISIKLEGNFKSIDQRAYSLLAALVNDRFKMAEIMSELHEFDDEPGHKSKKKKIQPNIEFERAMYA